MTRPTVEEVQKMRQAMPFAIPDEEVRPDWIALCDAYLEVVVENTRLTEEKHQAVNRFIRGEDKWCLVCGAKDLCDLKDDPYSPCTFDPTPMELMQRCRELSVENTQRKDQWAKTNAEYERVSRVASKLTVENARLREGMTNS